jgi:hypothetical protein
VKYACLTQAVSILLSFPSHLVVAEASPRISFLLHVFIRSMTSPRPRLVAPRFSWAIVLRLAVTN